MAMMLVCNVGSASRKYVLFDGERRVLEARAERDATGAAAVIGGAPERLAPAEYDAFLQRVLDACVGAGHEVGLAAVRVVAPGRSFARHAEADDAYVAALRFAALRDPVHVPQVLAEVEALRARGIRVVAVSDSAFHATLPEAARRYAIPAEVAERHDWYRYGYHGLSVASVARRIGAEDAIVCHLGGGSSVTALKGGESVDTTMGMSPLEGVVMATRSGSVDPGALLMYMEESGATPRDALGMLYEASGLLGLAGTADLRELIERDDAEAALAVEVLARSVAKAVASMVPALGSAGTLVFTGTIGERSAPLRARVVGKLAGLGYALDEAANDALAGEGGIGRAGTPGILVLATREDEEIRDAAVTIAGDAASA